MPIIKSAIKRAKQTIKRRERNVGIKRDIKDATKAFLATPTAKGLSAAQSELDTAVKKGLIKKNTAARRKSLLSKTAKAAGVKLATAAKTATVPKVAAVKPVAVKKPATVKKTAAAKKPVAKKPTTAKVAKKVTK
jgi:ribosomal protein S20